MAKKSTKQNTTGTDLVKDGGKWAGAGKNVVKNGEGPSVAAQHQSQTGKGELRTTLRQPMANTLSAKGNMTSAGGTPRKTP